MQQHCRAFGAHVRPLPPGFAQLVADGVLQQLRAIKSVADRLVPAAAGACKGRADRQMRTPVDALHARVQRRGARRVDGTQAEEDADRGTRPEAGAVTGLERAFELDVIAALTDPARAERRELRRQHRSGTDRRGRHPVQRRGVNRRRRLTQPWPSSDRSGWYKSGRRSRKTPQACRYRRSSSRSKDAVSTVSLSRSASAIFSPVWEAMKDEP